MKMIYEKADRFLCLDDHNQCVNTLNAFNYEPGCRAHTNSPSMMNYMPENTFQNFLAHKQTAVCL